MAGLPTFTKRVKFWLDFNEVTILKCSKIVALKIAVFQYMTDVLKKNQENLKTDFKLLNLKFNSLFPFIVWAKNNEI